MFANPAWTVDVTRVLTRRELATVLADARAQAEQSLNAQRNLIIVRLACCCGLRVSEIGALRLDDVNVDGARPHIRLRRETTKGKKARCVPLWWDAGTLSDLAEWKAERIRSCAACWRIGAVNRFSGRRSAGGFSRRARYSGWRGSER
jgi:integrase